ncbi:MAG: helix-hairpin-helix domain-containing protein [Methanoculleus sp.]
MVNLERQVTNSDVAGQLALMGRLLEVAGRDGYRAAAYARAARQVEHLSLPVAGLGEEALTRIPGIGTRIAGQIQEITETGSFREQEISRLLCGIGHRPPRCRRCGATDGARPLEAARHPDCG